MWPFIFLMGVTGIVLSILIAEFIPHNSGSARTVFWNTVFLISAGMFCIGAFGVMVQGWGWFMGEVLQ